MSPMQTYLRGIRKKFGYFPAWPPLSPYALGNVGRIVDNQFQYLTTLQQLGIEFDAVTGEKGDHLSHTSGRSVSVQIKSAGETLQGTSLPTASAGALVELSSTGAFVFQALGPTVYRIADQYKLTEQILAKFRLQVRGKRQWEEDWCIITEVIKAEKLTVLISESGSAKVELSASGPIPAGPVPLASAGVALSVTRKVGEVTDAVAEGDLTPLFLLRRLKRSLLRRIMRKVDTGDFVQAASGVVGGLPANLLELPDNTEMVPVLGPNGNPYRDWQPGPKPTALRPRSPDKTKLKSGKGEIGGKKAARSVKKKARAGGSKPAGGAATKHRRKPR